MKSGVVAVALFLSKFMKTFTKDNQFLTQCPEFCRLGLRMFRLACQSSS